MSVLFNSDRDKLELDYNRSGDCIKNKMITIKSKLNQIKSKHLNAALDFGNWIYKNAITTIVSCQKGKTQIDAIYILYTILQHKG